MNDEPEVERVRADPYDWPFMPLHPLPLEAPPVGSWAWLITERPRHSSFHHVVNHVLLEDDDGPVRLVVSACGRAWTADSFAAVVEGSDPVLARDAHGTRARCRPCDERRRSGRSIWSDRLRKAGLL